MVLVFDASSEININEGSLRSLDKKLQDIFLKSVSETAEEVEKDLDLTVETWKKKPKFRFRVDAARGRYTATLTTDSEVWRWIDLGTEEHKIPGSPINKLSFPGWGRNRKDSRGNYPETYIPSSEPNLFSSGELQYQGDRFVVSQKPVNHPGIEARNWSLAITEKHSLTFSRNLARNFAALSF